MTVILPAYYLHHARTYKLEQMPDGSVRGLLLNLKTGDFDEDNTKITEVMFAMAGEIFKLNEAEFIDETEQARHEYLVGEGPIFALYETIDGIYDLAESEGRQITDEELAFIRLVRRGTFKMWEEEFAHRSAGEPGKNTYTGRTFGPPETPDTTTEGDG